MTLRVKLFARARDLAGTDALLVELSPGATVADLRQSLAKTCPPLADFLPRCAIAVNNEFTQDNVVLPAHSEIALLPPVSGG